MCKRVCRVVSISMFIVAVIFIGYCFCIRRPVAYSILESLEWVVLK